MISAPHSEDLRQGDPNRRRRPDEIGTLPAHSKSPARYQSRVIVPLLLIVALSFTVRALTANFIRAHLNDAAWFQFGSYAVFDRQAQDVLDRKQPVFCIADASRTDRIVYPPGYTWWLAIIYKLTGMRSPVSVQTVQLVLDSLAVLLVVGIGVSAFGWNVGLTAGGLAAVSPLLAFSGATPNADAPTSWLVLGGAWCLVLAVKERKIFYAVAAGALLGAACWLRLNPLFLFVPWGLALAWLVQIPQRGERVLLGTVLVLSTLLVISPLVIRNVVVFYPQVAPTGLGFGWNLWAGIGETSRGPEFGAPCCDADMIEQDRRSMNAPPEAEIGLYYPDGIRRDRDRGRKALRVIASNPFWFAGVVTRRIAGHLKLFGEPAPHLGTAGINVTSSKSLPPERQGGILTILVNVLGALQSVMRTLVLPLMIIGVVIAWRRDRRMTVLILFTVTYYLFTLGVGHSEIRYGLPMQALLLVFAAVTLHALAGIVRRRFTVRQGA